MRVCRENDILVGERLCMYAWWAMRVLCPFGENGQVVLSES